MEMSLCTNVSLREERNVLTSVLEGPKGSRAKVISELRETQRQSQMAAQRSDSNGDSESPGYARRLSLLSPEMISICSDYFFTNLYPTQPILQRRKLWEAVSQMDTDVEAYCLVTALCAYVGRALSTDSSS